METLDAAVVRWLLADGRGHVDEACEALASGRETLAVVTGLRRSGLDPAQASLVVSAAVARGKALAAGVPGAERLILTREAQEQASDPSVARWRAQRAADAVVRGGLDADAGGAVLHDRCAGTGGDAVAMAQHHAVLAIERDEGRALLARDRAAVLGVPVEVVVGDALDAASGRPDAVVHADPDRRDADGRRARTLGDHRPSVAALRAATPEAVGRLLTVAPGVAWADPELDDEAAPTEVAFVQLRGSLVEAVLLDGAAADPGVRARAVLLPEGLEAARSSGDVDELAVGDIGSHLLVPAVAVTRARLQDDLGRPLAARRVARRRALLTTDEDPGPTPWFKVEPVLAVLPARAKALRSWLRDHPDRRVEVVLHGMEVDLKTFLRDAGRPATAPDDVRVHVVRRDSDAVLVVCGPRLT